ncbi:Ig-like domain-containing protein [Nocardioides rubriscoriae]|uniref:Ig-like domain-containing protein n=1 Tax=Nocardioides rubriscoriae TaxID=642762 RepID=UPI0011DFE8FC|nr:Ig-like domain-containing protein [Nocardioides rubriscoriae]
MADVRRAVTTLTALAALGALAALPAQADEGPADPGPGEGPAEGTGAPVAAADRLTILATPVPGPATLLDVLANDSDPDGDDLEICRVVLPEGSPLSVAQELVEGDPAAGTDTGGEQLLVGVDVNRAATATFTYYACDRDSLTPATVTVVVTPTPRVRGTAVTRPGRVRFTNPGEHGVVVLYGGRGERDADGRVAVPPGGSRTVRVERRRVVFMAVLQRSGRLVNHGTIRGVRLRGDHGPAGATSTGRRDPRRWPTAR